MKMTEEEIVARADRFFSEKSNWNAVWEKISAYLSPDEFNFYNPYDSTPARQKNALVFDNTGIVSGELLAGALHSMLTNPTLMFFEFSTGDDEIDEDKDASEYLHKVSRLVHIVLNNTNFQTEIHSVYYDEVQLGTGAMFIEETEDEDMMCFHSLHLGEIATSRDSKGRLSEIYRIFKMNAAQIIEKFYADISDDDVKMREALGDTVVDAFNKGDTRKFELYHAVYREDFTAKKFKFQSKYILKGMQDNQGRNKHILLKEGGFRTCPYVVPRWTRKTGEEYGRGPGWAALPEVKTINAMTKATIQGAQKTANPPIQVPDDGFLSPKKADPGAVLFYRAGSSDRIETIFKDVRVDVSVEVTRERQEKVRDSYYINQLQLRNGPQMTATEVSTRKDDAMQILGPVYARQNHEFLRPLVERVYDIISRKGKIPEPPSILKGVDVQPKYTSAIARAQRIDEGNNVLKAFQAVSPFLGLDQSSIAIFNIDKVIRKVWGSYNAPQSVLRSAQETEDIKQAQAQAQQQMNQMSQETHEADVVQKNAQAAATLQGAQ